MEEIIKINFCKFCKSCNNNCMNIETKTINDMVVYKCTNYESNIDLEEYMRYIKYDYFDDDGNHIAIIQKKTPVDIIIELRKHFDFIRSKEGIKKLDN